MHRTTRSAVLVAAAASTALLLSACSSGGGGGDAKKGSGPKSNAMDINAKPASDLKQGGILHIANRGITNMNMYHVDGSNADEDVVRTMVLPQLFTYDDKAQPTPNKDFLLSAKSEQKGGKQVVTYKLNPKAKWSDGKPVSWKDFEQIWKINSSTDGKYQVRDSAGYVDIGSVKKGATDQDVIVTFDKAQSEWQRLFSELEEASTIDTPEKFNKGWIQKVPSSAGPFKVQKWDKGAKSITLVPDPKWWGDKPKLSKIVDSELDADAQIDAVLNKELDATDVANAEYLKRVKGKAGIRIDKGAPWDVVNIVFGKKGPMADVKVRQAIMMATNREALAKINSNGMPAENPLVGNHLYMPSEKGYKDNSGKFGKFSAENADKLLEQAGWKSPGKGKIRTKDGKQLKLNFVMSAGSSKTSLDIVDAVQNMLQQVGIKMTIDKVNDADFFTDKYVNGGNFDLTMFRWIDATWKSDSFATYRDPKGKNPYQNFGRVGDPAVDDAFKAGMSAPSAGEAAKEFNKADTKIWEIGNSIPLFQNYEYKAVNKKLANYGAFGMSSTDWTKVGFTK